MSVLALILLIAAGVVFLVAAWAVVADRVRLVALGLAIFCAFVLALHFTTPTIGQ